MPTEKRVSDAGWDFQSADASKRIYKGYRLERYGSTSWRILDHNGKVLDQHRAQSPAEAQRDAEIAAERRDVGRIRVAVEVHVPDRVLTPEEREQARRDECNFDFMHSGCMVMGFETPSGDGGFLVGCEVLISDQHAVARGHFKSVADAQRFGKEQAELFKAYAGE